MPYRLIIPILFLTIACHAGGPEYFHCIMEELMFDFDDDTIYQVTYVKAAYVDGMLRGEVYGMSRTTKEPSIPKERRDRVIPGVYFKDVRIKSALSPVINKEFWEAPFEGSKWYRTYWGYKDFEIPLTEKELKAVKIKSVKSKEWENGTTKECVKIYTRSE